MKVQMTATGKIKEVTSNVTRDLVDKGKASVKKLKARVPFYSHRQMTPHRRDYKKK